MTPIIRCSGEVRYNYFNPRHYCITITGDRIRDSGKTVLAGTSMVSLSRWPYWNYRHWSNKQTRSIINVIIASTWLYHCKNPFGLYLDLDLLSARLATSSMYVDVKHNDLTVLYYRARNIPSVLLHAYCCVRSLCIRIWKNS